MRNKQYLSVLKPIAAVVAVLVACVALFLALEIPDLKRFKRYCDYPDKTALLAAEPDAVKKIETVELDGATYEMLNMGFVGFAPSGAAYLVYDANGRLVDRTYDEGDDSRFQRKWSSCPSIPERVCSWEELVSLDDPNMVEKRYSTRVPRHLSPLGKEVPVFNVAERMKTLRIPSLSIKPPANLMDAVLFLQTNSVPYDGSGEVILFALRPLAESEHYPEIPELRATDISFDEALRLITDSVNVSFFVRSDGVVVIEPIGIRECR